MHVFEHSSGSASLQDGLVRVKQAVKGHGLMPHRLVMLSYAGDTDLTDGIKPPPVDISWTQLIDLVFSDKPEDKAQKAYCECLLGEDFRKVKDVKAAYEGKRRLVGCRHAEASMAALLDHIAVSCTCAYISWWLAFLTGRADRGGPLCSWHIQKVLPHVRNDLVCYEQALIRHPHILE